MYTKGDLMFMYCETPLHAGSGSSLSAIDLPIQRERYTNFPTVAGSGIKGAVREWFERQEKNPDGSWRNGGEANIETVFGPEKEGADHAGAVAFTDARVLLFPVRSMKGVFAWITSPAVLGRLQRDMQMIGTPASWTSIPSPNRGQVFGTSENTANETKNSEALILPLQQVVLEEYTFSFSQGADQEVNTIAKWIADNVVPRGDEYDHWKKKIKSSFLVAHDDNFSDFVQHSTEVNARIKIENDTKTVKEGALFYQEDLPCETVLYSAVLTSIPHKENPPDAVKDAEGIRGYVRNIDNNRTQIGGDETVGRGIVKTRIVKGGA